MPYVGNTPAEKYASFEVQHFTTSATTSYTLTHAVANELDIRLVLNNVIQQPGASYAYTASATTLTLSSATTGTDTLYCVYIGKAVQTVTPPADSITEPMISASNSPTNGYVLSAQSGAAGGLTWAADAAGTVTGYTNGVDNRVITSSGTTTLNGEANLTFDGTQLVLTDSTEGTDNLLVKTTADGSISMALEKSDLKYDLGLDHNNDGSQNFYIRERTKDGSTTNSLRLIIDESGAVTKPLQPAFLTVGAGGSAVAVATQSNPFASSMTEIYDKNSDLSSTAIFTAPVTGTYVFYMHTKYGSADGENFSHYFLASNRNSYFMNVKALDTVNAGSNTQWISGSCSVDMDASDTMQIRTDWEATANRDRNTDPNWTYFSGYLLC